MVEEGSVEKSGWAHKRGYGEDSWKKKWLEIKDGKLVYYASADGTSPKGILFLENCAIRKKPLHSRKFAFELCTQASSTLRRQAWWIHRAYVFDPGNEAERDDWMRAIVTARGDAFCPDIWDSFGGSGEKPAASPGGGGSPGAGAVGGMNAWLRNHLPEACKPVTPAAGSEVWLLGRCYTAAPGLDGVAAWKSFFDDFGSRLWYTYRTGFERIQPSQHTTDTGWGCMLRSGQMMLAQAFLCHYLGRDWKVDMMKLPPPMYLKILKSFNDDPNEAYSIHKIAQSGQYRDKVVGEWHGPTTICHILRDLTVAAAPDTFALYVSNDGVVYQDQVEKICRKEVSPVSTQHSLPLDPDWKSLVILLPLRLGLDNLNPGYKKPLSQYFAFPQSLGFVGGKPRSSFYFVAAQGEGTVMYLDPHCPRPSVKFSETVDVSSFHCRTVRKMNLTDIDPSLALGFYCHTRADFHDFCARVRETNDPRFTVMTICEVTPQFHETALGDDDDDLVML